jgi:CRP/FNR family transcriptional regulator, cyclic AMP receptor protein
VTTQSPAPDNEASTSLYDLIASQPFFAGLTPPHLQLLTESAMEIRFEPGQFLLEEGSPANRFYLILEGQVVLEAESPEHELIPLDTLGPGDELGWSWLFPSQYLQSGARALVPTRALFFYGTRLADLCEQDHDFGFQLLKRITKTMIDRLLTLKKLSVSTTT